MASHDFFFHETKEYEMTFEGEFLKLKSARMEKCRHSVPGYFVSRYCVLTIVAETKRPRKTHDCLCGNEGNVGRRFIGKPTGRSPRCIRNVALKSALRLPSMQPGLRTNFGAELPKHNVTWHRGLV